MQTCYQHIIRLLDAKSIASGCVVGMLKTCISIMHE